MVEAFAREGAVPALVARDGIFFFQQDHRGIGPALQYLQGCRQADDAAPYNCDVVHCRQCRPAVRGRPAGTDAGNGAIRQVVSGDSLLA